eukprot:TRINITY_DN3035_c0_g1_i4.p1 TRINITY_DN3035_c0_g1~~TRINITY_DN3035_c0_g1_i4.p1  ORF type:complete len:396 (-),score=80.28 TRINITY_DN3035_c0_g1_i4:146-1333(-)
MLLLEEARAVGLDEPTCELASKWFASKGEEDKARELREECRVFEVLRGQAEREAYIVCHLARVVAMTAVQAAMRREDLIKGGFCYDAVVIEEAAQLTEIESFIPFTLQQDHERLKTVVLLGDTAQLPPVVSSLASQREGNLAQSMFARLRRLGAPRVQLQEQGRCRQSLLQLFSWRYPSLTSIPSVVETGPFLFANPGFSRDVQFIDVAGSEATPRPHFYQNVAEAEFVIATYMYMVLLGYPADRIALLTTYNGQKALLRDIFQVKCAYSTRFKRPKITTVDKFQGQQSDYVLLSLVRTQEIGHFQDIRRAIVALSRARLGLYIFGKWDLFSSSFSLKPCFAPLADGPRKLVIYGKEKYPSERKSSDQPPSETREISDFKEMYGVVQELLLAIAS